MAEACFLPTQEPCIIGAAIPGAASITVAEQVESAHAAFEAGAALVHLGASNDETPGPNPATLATLQDGIRKHCPGMIVQFSTGSQRRTLDQREVTLHLRPDMASLATGSCNFPTMVYENPPDLVRSLAARMRELGVKPAIEVFDLAMLYNAAELVDAGLLVPPPHVCFVLGVENALPARRDILDFEVRKLREVLAGATWTAAGVGGDRLRVTYWALEMGGHCCTGIAEHLGADGGNLAASNAQLVSRVADICAGFGRPVATPRQARGLLGLAPAATAFA
jgi:3-keto-5-aminohexanoate cleavage enzyme